MASKEQKPTKNVKKKGKSLKEKRAAKKEKRGKQEFYPLAATSLLKLAGPANRQ